MALDKRYPELDPIAIVNGSMLLAIYDYDTDTLYHVPLSLLVPKVDASAKWQDNISYSIDDVTSLDGKFWRSLVNGNLNNLPVEGGGFWTEVSKAAPGLNFWAAGVYTELNQSVYFGSPGFQYYLNHAVPFASSNFAAELALGYWVQINDHDKGGYDASLTNDWPSSAGLRKEDFYDVIAPAGGVPGVIDGQPILPGAMLVWKGTYWKVI